MLDVKELTLIRGKSTILSNVSFTLKKGSVTVLLGKNGSGKTSLLRCLSRELIPFGSITLAGDPLASLPPRERARRLGLMPQLLPPTDMSVRELCLLGRSPHRRLLSRLSRTDRAAVSHALEVTGLMPLAERSVHSLSGGEQRRAFFATLLAQDTPLLLLDEPTAHLDAAARRHLLSLVSRVAREEGRTVLCVLHELSDAVRLADRVLVLDNGQLAFDGTTAEFIASPLPEHHFGTTRHHGEDGLPLYY
ncbi:MAG: ABC transporter ATP-binding protein [Clostridia bacterium]|nr:ABC transporter ATP-binding protein [Clostridia bacterium]